MRAQPVGPDLSAPPSTEQTPGSIWVFFWCRLLLLSYSSLCTFWSLYIFGDLTELMARFLAWLDVADAWHGQKEREEEEEPKPRIHRCSERITIDRRTRHLKASRSIQLAVGADTSTINNSRIWSSERKLPSFMGTCRKKKKKKTFVASSMGSERERG